MLQGPSRGRARQVATAGASASFVGVVLVAGVDSSTQSTKVLVVDAEDGSVVATGRSAHLVEGTDGARETHPELWGRALGDALAATGCAGRVAAISVAAQQHGLVVLGRDRTPLHPAILWNDTRGAPDAARLVEALGGRRACSARVGSVLTAAFTVSSWAWLRRSRPELAAEAATVCLPHDYLGSLLSGQLARTDRSDASGTGWWSPTDEDYAEDVLSLPEVGLEREQLAEVLGPSDPTGEVSSGAAERFGLTPGTPIAPGAGDNAAAALGLGLLPGELCVSLGTSGTAFSVSTEPCADASGVVAGFASADGRYLPLACTLNAALAVDSVAALLGLDRDDVVPSGEVVLLPWLDGERTPDLPAASGSLAGLRHGTDRRAVLQAAYEGAAWTLAEALGEVALRSGAGTGPVVLVGGGSRSRVWQDALGRVTGRPLLVPAATELVALGAAVQAAALLEASPPDAVARRWRTREGESLAALRRDDELCGRLARWCATVSAPLRPGGPVEG